MADSPTRVRRHSLLRRCLAALLALVIVAGIALVAWTQIGVMGPEAGPLERVEHDERIGVSQTSAAYAMRPAGERGTAVGLVFYPGAKVDPRSYTARLAGLVTQQHMTVVIAKPWLGMALFDRRGLDAFTSAAPEVRAWIVGGHSLGGVRACQTAEDAQALLLFGSYCANDLSGSSLPVTSLAGSDDGLSTPQKIAEHRPNLPAGAVMTQIEGANHASFGDYGPQRGDGEATIADAAMDAAVLQAAAELAGRVRG